MSYAAATGDLDGDGDIDLVVASLGERVQVYENCSAGNGRLLVRLRGRGGNSRGVGATVRIEVGAQRLIRQQFPHSGLLSSNDDTLHFGLGKATRIDRLTVTWPSGAVQEFRDLAIDSLVTIRAPQDSREKKKIVAKNPLATVVDTRRESGGNSPARVRPHRALERPPCFGRLRGRIFAIASLPPATTRDSCCCHGRYPSSAPRSRAAT
jgi:hypothetical protein